MLRKIVYPAFGGSLKIEKRSRRLENLDEGLSDPPEDDGDVGRRLNSKGQTGRFFFGAETLVVRYFLASEARRKSKKNRANLKTWTRGDVTLPKTTVTSVGA
jgi:hypothetical protein